jgi:hypothetical protein
MQLHHPAHDVQAQAAAGFVGTFVIAELEWMGMKRAPREAELRSARAG